MFKAIIDLEFASCIMSQFYNVSHYWLIVYSRLGSLEILDGQTSNCNELFGKGWIIENQEEEMKSFNRLEENIFRSCTVQ